jgi:hypothetical protein
VEVEGRTGDNHILVAHKPVPFPLIILTHSPKALYAGDLDAGLSWKKQGYKRVTKGNK